MTGKMSPEGSPEKAPQMGLAEQIKKTVNQRDEVTENLFTQMTGGQSPRGFVEKACKLAEIEPPKQNEPLAYHVHLLQEHLGYPLKDNAKGCDGKLGPYTFADLTKKYPKLNVQPRQAAIHGARAKRRHLLANSGLPTPPSSLNPKTNIEREPVDPRGVSYFGDSLTQQYTKYVLSRGDFKKHKNKDYKIGRWARTMKKRMDNNLDYYARKSAIVIGAGTNDLEHRSANAIFGDIEAMYIMLLKKNPNIQIVALTLLPCPGNEARNRKIEAINREIRAFASKFPKNIRVVDLHKGFMAAIKKYGRSKALYGDRVHMKPWSTKRAARAIQDSLNTGSNRNIEEYFLS